MLDGFDDFQIDDAIVSTLLSHWPCPPPDVEALRIFLILPVYHNFSLPTILFSYTSHVLNLSIAASKVLSEFDLSRSQHLKDWLWKVMKVILMLIRQLVEHMDSRVLFQFGESSEELD